MNPNRVGEPAEQELSLHNLHEEVSYMPTYRALSNTDPSIRNASAALRLKIDAWIRTSDVERIN